jgi:hypothetical protein
MRDKAEPQHLELLYIAKAQYLAALPYRAGDQ